jgi:hypothetical protein
VCQDLNRDLILNGKHPSQSVFKDERPAFPLVKGIRWAWEELNLRPHPYQQSGAHRYATLRFWVLLTFLWAA